MSVRSHNSRDSYKNRPLTNGGSRRNRNPTPIPPEALAPPESLGVGDFCEACKRCPYKRLVDKALIETEEPVREIVVPHVFPATVNVQNVTPVQSEDQKKKGLLQRFGEYVARNQAANKAAGDTSLMEDLAKYGKNLSNGAASLGQEEIDGLNRKKAVKHSAKEDDELLDFLSGKRKK